MRVHGSVYKAIGSPIELRVEPGGRGGTPDVERVYRALKFRGVLNLGFGPAELSLEAIGLQSLSRGCRSGTHVALRHNACSTLTCVNYGREKPNPSRANNLNQGCLISTGSFEKRNGRKGTATSRTAVVQNNPHIGLPAVGKGVDHEHLQNEFLRAV